MLIIDLCAIWVATASPCGMCRQFIREFGGLDMPILMFDGDGGRVDRTLGEVSILNILTLCIASM